MNEQLLLVFLLFIYFLLGHQLLTLLHELGHTLPLLLFSQEKVMIQLGKTPTTFDWSWGRLQLKVQLPSFSGFYRYDKTGVSSHVQLYSLLGGPLVSLLLTGVLGGVAAVLHNQPEPSVWQTLVIIMAADALMQFVMTAVPLKYPAWYGVLAGWPSDGYQIRNLLRQSVQK